MKQTNRIETLDANNVINVVSDVRELPANPKPRTLSAGTGPKNTRRNAGTGEKHGVNGDRAQHERGQ